MRDDFPKATKEILARRVNSFCSNPHCQKPTTGPHENSARSINIGVAAHITAASPGGERYDLTLSSKQRKAPDNGIWLCQNCAKLVDNDSQKYTAQVLRDWKQNAEIRSSMELNGIVRKFQNAENTILGSVYIPIPNIYELPYDDAREKLIESGWQPQMKHWSFVDDFAIQYGNGSTFWERGYWEIDSSSGTGLAYCRFGFTDVYRNKLKVITAGEELPELDCQAKVINWFFENEFSEQEY